MTAAQLAAAARAIRDPRSTDRESLDRSRDRRVRALVSHAYDRVPYYRDLFVRRGLDPRAICDVGDVAKLPVTSKRDLQASAASELIAEGTDPGGLIVRRTSGSTGQPLQIRRTWGEERLLGAFRWRALRSMGSKLTDRYAEIEEVAPHDGNDRRIVHAMLERLGVLRQTRVDALASPQEICQRLRAFGPDILCGYAGVVARLADVATASDLTGLRPRVIAVHSDTVTARMRTVIGSAFNAPVFEIYDSNEFNVIAWQCLETAELHVCDDSVVLEVLVDGRPAEPGERGEAIITALHSLAMPFLRYRIGDLVVQGSPRCACGAPFSTIRAVEGRMVDYFPLADGRVVHPYEIIAILDRTAPWLLRYRMIQERRDHVTLEVVARETPADAAIETVREAVATFLGPLVHLDVELGEDLPLEGHAKLRICRSLVASQYEAGGSPVLRQDEDQRGPDRGS